ncbi:MAG: alpha/beta hydrolase [Ornithinimicrobium sp.]
MNQTKRSTVRGWWRLALGIAWLGVSAWSWLTRPDPLLAGHPALPVTLVVAAAVGVLLIVLGARDLRGRTPRPRRRWLAVTLAVLGTAISSVALGSLVFLRPFSATPDAIEAMAGCSEVAVSDSATRITLTTSGDNHAPSTGLIFQPGARVDARAYVPLLDDLATQGYLVVIVKQPFGIGFTAVNRPSAIIEDYPEIEHWALSGHSLGGVAAATFAGDNAQDVDGVVFWASYPLGSLSDTDLAVTSIAGSNDGLSTPADIEDSRADLPDDANIVMIEGAVHAHFGDYGPQPGDGEPTVPRESAQADIIEASLAAVTALGN